MTRLVVVCGLSGTGKTTLASRLARELGVVCLHKDSVKAALHDQLGLVTDRSVLVFRALVEEQLANGVGLIAEATFAFEDDAAQLARWRSAYGVEIVTVVCEASIEVRRSRVLARSRHPAHAEADRRVLVGIETAVFDRSVLPGTHVVVDTEQPLEDCVRRVLAELG